MIRMNSIEYLNLKEINKKMYKFNNISRMSNFLISIHLVWIFMISKTNIRAMIVQINNNSNNRDKLLIRVHIISKIRVTTLSIRG